MIPVEEALNQAQQEVAKLKMSLKNYEGLIETYKNQVWALKFSCVFFFLYL